jgi:single-stranded DNA-binding protein
MYNQIFLVGWLSDNMTTGSTASGSGYVKFSVGCKKNFPKKENGQDVIDANGRKVYESSFFNVTVWGKNAEYVSTLNLCKGDLVSVAGTMDLHYYNDSNGVRKLGADVSANKVMLCQRKSDRSGGGYKQSPQQGFQQQSQPQQGFQQQPQPQQNFQQQPQSHQNFQQPQPQQNFQQPQPQQPQQAPANFNAPQQQPAAFGNNQQPPAQAPANFSAPAGGTQVFNQPTNFSQ